MSRPRRRSLAGGTPEVPRCSPEVDRVTYCGCSSCWSDLEYYILTLKIGVTCLYTLRSPPSAVPLRRTGWRCPMPRMARKRKQAPRSPNASRSSVAALLWVFNLVCAIGAISGLNCSCGKRSKPRRQSELQSGADSCGSPDKARMQAVPFLHGANSVCKMPQLFLDTGPGSCFT